MTGLNMLAVSAASFKMGGGDTEYRPDGLPVHQVVLSQDFYISEQPVPYSLFLEFYKQTAGGLPDVQNYKGFVAGVSWYEAEAFCEWLCKTQGENYRLPTEAEWEYCARSSKTIGTDRMCDLNLREWCFDWYDAYSGLDETDPAGPDTGYYKVVRGGFLDSPLRYNEYPLDVWMRCALPPNFRHYREDAFNDFGRHNIGFRVAKGGKPKTNGKNPAPAVCLHVKQEEPAVCMEKEALKALREKPYYRKRYLFPVPPDTAPSAAIRAMGLNPSLRSHNHSPGLAVAPNGDLLVSIYSSYHEYDAEAGLMAARLRYGADEWEMPDLFLNPVGVNDHAPLLFTDDDGTIYHFWGWPQYDCAFPFQFVCSKDSGATWSLTKFPLFTEKAERVVRQPVNTVVHAKDGYYYVASDSSEGSVSVLWRTRDLVHWENPKGRTAGRHSTAVELKDGSLLAMGGKNSNIDGYMPKAVSCDQGDSWTVSKTPFPACGSGQRPCIIRLRSGRLFMCGDFQNKQGKRPAGAAEWERGSYAAYSEDEGKTWKRKRLWGTQRQKNNPEQFGGQSTLGYSVCRQSQDGLIHVITSNNRPCLHLSFNEAWLLSDGEEPADEGAVMQNKASAIQNVKEYTEAYPDGRPKCVYSGGIADNGLFLLHGQEKWFYPSGSLMTECNYRLGEKTGSYIHYNRQGTKIWEWIYRDDGTAVYKTYYEDGSLKSAGSYKGRIANGKAQTFDRSGEVLSEVLFEEGTIILTKDLKKETPSPMAEILEGQTD